MVVEIDAEVFLSDGTVLRYVSTEKIAKARQALVDSINKNRKRNFSIGENLAVKTASATVGGLLCWAGFHVKNYRLRTGLAAAMAIASSTMFFYPEYVRYDVEQVENHKMKSELSYTMSGSYDIFSENKREGLNRFLDCLDQCIMDSKMYEDGIVIIE